jgi:hypothetical protein
LLLERGVRVVPVVIVIAVASPAEGGSAGDGVGDLEFGWGSRHGISQRFPDRDEPEPETREKTGAGAVIQSGNRESVRALLSDTCSNKSRSYVPILEASRRNELIYAPTYGRISVINYGVEDTWLVELDYDDTPIGEAGLTPEGDLPDVVPVWSILLPTPFHGRRCEMPFTFWKIRRSMAEYRGWELSKRNWWPRSWYLDSRE